MGKLRNDAAFKAVTKGVKGVDEGAGKARKTGSPIPLPEKGREQVAGKGVGKKGAARGGEANANAPAAIVKGLAKVPTVGVKGLAKATPGASATGVDPEKIVQGKTDRVTLSRAVPQMPFARKV